MQKEEFYMRKCLDLASKGLGSVSANPMVGSVVVYKDEIIGEGYHKRYGDNHAEVNAIANVTDKSLLSKSTLYVNLEPCAHFGKTPPCSNLIIKYKIPKVVIGSIDIFAKVSGRGIEMMRNAGVEVILGVLEHESISLNKRFFCFHKNKRPYIILKWAKSKDDFIAPQNQNDSFWMTSNESKKLVHKWRAEEDAILIGRITAEKDNPNLTVREITGSNPIRIVIDRRLKLSEELNLFNNEAKTIIFNASKSDKKTCSEWIRVDFKRLIKNILMELYEMNIQSVIIEGGAITLQTFINEGIWDEARIFTTETDLNSGIRSPKLKGKAIQRQIIGTDNLEVIKNA